MFQYFRTLFASVEWRLFSERDKGRQNYDSIQKQGCKRRLQHIQRDFSFECYWEDLCRVHIISRSISCWEAVPWIAAWLPSQQIYYEHDSAVCCISPLLTSPKHLILSEEKGYALMDYSTKNRLSIQTFFLSGRCTAIRKHVSHLKMDELNCEEGGLIWTHTVPFELKCGVKQDCVLAAALFRIFFAVLNYALHDDKKNVVIVTVSYAPAHIGRFFYFGRLSAKTNTRHIPVRKLLFADGATFVSHCETVIQWLMDRFAAASFSGHKQQKTVVMNQLTCTGTSQTDIVKAPRLEKVNNFCYLRPFVSNHWSFERKIQ